MRLIDADELNFEKLQDTNNEEIPIKEYLAFLKGAIAAEELIKNAPTINAAPIVSSRWIRIGVTPYSNKIVWNCSNCGCNYRLNIGDKPKKYCGDCGAKMDEEVDNG